VKVKDMTKYLTPAGIGIIVGWGQEPDWPMVPAGEVVIKLEKSGDFVSFDPKEIRKAIPWLL